MLTEKQKAEIAAIALIGIGTSAVANIVTEKMDRTTAWIVSLGIVGLGILFALGASRSDHLIG